MSTYSLPETMLGAYIGCYLNLDLGKHKIHDLCAKPKGLILLNPCLSFLLGEHGKLRSSVFNL